MQYNGDDIVVIKEGTVEIFVMGLVASSSATNCAGHVFTADMCKSR